MKITSFITQIKKRPLLFAPAAGVLLALAYHFKELWLLGCIALIPLFLSIASIQGRRGRFVAGALAGLVYFGSVFWFIFSAHPIRWAGIESGSASFLLVFITWVISVTIFSLFLGLWSMCVHWFNKRSVFLSAFLLASSWVVMEWASGLFFSVLWFGEGGMVGSHWTFGYIGYILAESPLLLSLASLGGVYLLSFVVVTTNFLITRSLSDVGSIRWVKPILFVGCVALVAGILYESNVRAAREAQLVRVASIYTSFEPSFFNSPESLQIKNVQVSSLFDTILYEDKNPELIVLPENTAYMNSLSEEERRELVDRMSQKNDTVIIDTARTFEQAKQGAVASLSFDTKEGTEHYTKQLLVPTAEYIPFSLSLFGDLFLSEGWDDYFKTRLAFKREGGTTLGGLKELRVGALFCSEVLTPSLYREATLHGANILTNSASHAFLNNSLSLYPQIVKFSKVRAVENNRYFVQAGNKVPSFVIDNHGRLLGETTSEDHSILYAEARAIANKTIATRLGNFPVFLFSLFTILGLVLHFKEKRNNGNRKKLK